MAYFALCDHSIDCAALRQEMDDPHCGAFVCFDGVVRNHHQNKAVSGLYYQAYATLALHEGQKIIDQACTQFEIKNAVCVHRTGQLEIGDIAVWVGVSAAHRDAAFAACRFIIDQIKKDVPIWKKEFYPETEHTATQWLHPQPMIKAKENSG